MSYKLEIPDPVVFTCDYCGAIYSTLHPNLTKKPTCSKKACRELRRTEISRKSLNLHRKEKNLKSCEKYHANLVESRKYNRELSRRLLADPTYRTEVNARKRERRRKAALLRQPTLKPCQFCQTPVALKNIQFADGVMICCQSAECRHKKRAEINRRYLERHAKVIAERNRNWNRSERGKSYKHNWFKKNYNTQMSSLSNTPV
jgi:hypothetical protein